MDSIDFDNVKAEKAKALQRFNRFRSIGRFFRAAEVCVALLFLSWSFTHLPFAVQISGAFLRRIAAVVSTPLFVFLLGNVIIVVLFIKSSDLTTGGISATNTESEIYQAFVKSVENRPKPSDEDLREEIIYEDKQVIITDDSNSNTNSNQNDDDESILPHVEIDSDSSKVYRRSKSDVCGTKQSPKLVVKRSLKRSETEKRRETKNDADDEDKNYPEDNLSNEEFQKTIEAFIAKQLMFRRHESLAVVVHNKLA